MDRKSMNWGSAAAEEDGYWRKGPWTAQEDKLLVEHVNLHGEGSWNSVSKQTGLRRSGKSCRLRWVNYLRPDLRRGKITPEEESIIIELHALWGNRWSAIARCLPGRTDNEIKNYWRTHFKKSKPSKRIEKAREQFLMQQQKQMQKKQEEEEEEEHRQHQNDMRVIMNNNEHEVPLEITDYAMQDDQYMQQEIAMDYMYQYPFSHVLLDQGGGGECLVDDALFISEYGSSPTAEEVSNWGSLWHLDDLLLAGVESAGGGSSSLQVED